MRRVVFDLTDMHTHIDFFSLSWWFRSVFWRATRAIYVYILIHICPIFSAVDSNFFTFLMLIRVRELIPINLRIDILATDCGIAVIWTNWSCIAEGAYPPKLFRFFFFRHRRRSFHAHL